LQDEQAREVYKVWTITVRVNCGGVSRLELRGPLLQDVWISDAFLLNDDGRNVNLVPADAIKNAHTFRLVIGTCEIEVSPATIISTNSALPLFWDYLTLLDGLMTVYEVA
jgi:hypothetical protein